MNDIETVREALRPFAEACENIDDDIEKWRDEDNLWESSAALSLTAGDLRRARAALAAFERIIAAQAQAVKDEREACAKIFDEWPTFDVWRSQAAAAIRARQNGGEG